VVLPHWLIVRETTAPPAAAAASRKGSRRMHVEEPVGRR